MISASRKSERIRSIDPALVGTWVSGPDTIAFGSDAWLFSLGNSLATISPDGQTLTDAGTTFTRTSGGGQTIEGNWTATQIDSGITWVEDRYYQADGTYTIQWTADGTFDSLLFGTYTHRNDVLAIRERRAMVTTGPADSILFDVPYGPDSAGTYAIDPQGQLIITINGSSTPYSPV